MGGFRYSSRTMSRNLARRVPARRFVDAMPRPKGCRRRRSLRKLKIIEHISLDGVIQAPSGLTEDGDYPHNGWPVPHRDPAAGGE